MLLRGLCRLLRPNIYIDINRTSAIRGPDFVGSVLVLATAVQRGGRSLVVGLGPCLGPLPVRAIASVAALRPVFSQIKLTNEPKGSIPLIQNRYYASRIKPKKKKPVRDLEPVVHNLDRYYGLDPSQPKLHFEEVEEFKTANDTVKKIFSLEFSSNAEIKEYKSHTLMQELKEKIGIEPHADKKTLPLRIAKLTMAVRNCGKHVIKNPKDKANKRKMLINIDRRRKFLKMLRQQNYNHFEDIQNELGIKWVPFPKFHWIAQTRRRVERRLIKNKAFWEKVEAQKAFAKQRRNENMVEIVRLKKELGKDLTEEEKQFDQENQ